MRQKILHRKYIIAYAGGEIMTVYADILFLVNFSMDFLTLYLTGRLMHKTIRKWRLIIAAFVGGTAGTAYLLTTEIIATEAKLFTILFGIFISTVMAIISFGKSTSKIMLVRESLSVWGAGTLLGGIMTLILSLGEPVYIADNSNFFTAFGACFLISIGLTRMFSIAKSKKSVRVRVEAVGIVHEFDALCDSGSFATEPISGLPVIIVRKTAIEDWVEKLEAIPCQLKFRMVPLHGIAGDCLLKGFLPEKLTVNKIETRAVIAVQDNSVCFAGFDGIVPATICKNL